MITAVPTSGSTTRAELNLTYVWLISSVAALGGLLFGWDWVVIGGAKAFFEPYFGIAKDAVVNGASVIQINEKLSGWANSCALLGCLAGSLITGVLCDKLGRKKLLIFAALLFALSSIFTGWANQFSVFILWRMIGGIAIGMASNLSPLYIAEIAPAQFRGRLVALNQLTIVLGIFAAQVINMFLAQKVPDGATATAIAASWNGQYGWRWMFTLVALPSLFFLVAALFVPESPRWLVKRGLLEPANRTLTRIGGADYAAREMAGIRQTLAAETGTRIPLRELLSPRLLKILLIGCGLAVLQQWSGINVLFNYADNIFKQAGF
ncbi:MAG TPA: MFS transporter, partial [Verrucomicrobiae bacterium]